MPGSITDRISCLVALASGAPDLRRVHRWSALKSCLTWYGPQRFAIQRRLQIEDIDETFLWITAGEYGLAWPRTAPIERLLRALIEIQVHGNPHYYFDASTRVRPGDTVIDVGACEGAFALECLTRRRAGRVIGFEPDPVQATGLRLTAERNGLSDRLRVVEAALSDRTAELRFVRNAADPLASHLLEAGTEDGAGAVAAIAVRAVTLDGWAAESSLERLDFLKIDAEGADLAVLQGARRTLTRWHPAIAATTYHRPEHGAEMASFLESLGAGYQLTLRGVNVFDSRPRPMMLLARDPGRP